MAGRGPQNEKKTRKRRIWAEYESVEISENRIVDNYTRSDK